MGRRGTFRLNAQGVALCAGTLLCAVTTAFPARAQNAEAIVQQAAEAELASNRNDQSHWRYVETEIDRSKYVVVETENGAVKRHIDEEGRPASAAVLREDDEYNQKFIHNPEMRERQRQNGEHDERDANELINLMAKAFVWKVESDGPETVTLSFRPNDSFRPPDMESRVMGEMAGTMVVNKAGHRIKTFKGALSEDINIGFGLLARIKQGGTFDIERRMVAPGMWAITETHVHIVGHALFFKTIGQQEDEVKSQFTPVPLGTTLEQALGMLTAK